MAGAVDRGVLRALCLMLLLGSGCQIYPGLAAPGTAREADGASPPGSEAPASCVDLEHLDLGEASFGGDCFPVNPLLPQCQQAADQGVLVARTLECIEASLADCGPWSHDDSWALVLACDPYGGCSLPVVLDGIEDCGDRIEVRFSVFTDCEGDCDAIVTTCRVIHIPNDPRPVHGFHQSVEGRCP